MSMSNPEQLKLVETVYLLPSEATAIFARDVVRVGRVAEVNKQVPRLYWHINAMCSGTGIHDERSYDWHASMDEERGNRDPGRKAEVWEERRRLRSLCGQCQVRADCVLDELQNHSGRPYGFRAGLDERARYGAWKQLALWIELELLDE